MAYFSSKGMFMKRFLLLALIPVSLAFFSPRAQAEFEIYHAGTPDEVRVETNPTYRIPDIYQRQLDYRDKRILLVKDLKRRQRAFVEPTNVLRNQYRQDVQDLHSSFEGDPADID